MTTQQILVIDDEEYVRDSMAKFLEDFGYQVNQAENGRRGLEMIRYGRPDLILCDLRMPEMDGLEFLGELSEIDSQTPTIIISGAGNVGDTVQALRLGAWDYIIKPIHDMDVLRHSVDRVMERKRLLEEQAQYRKDLEAANRELQHSLDTLEETRDKLVQSEKMAALGELVAGVAHEINTPVGIGVTAASFLDTRTRDFKKKYQGGGLRRSELDHFLETVEEVSQSIQVNMEKAGALISSFKQVAVDQACEELRQFNVKGYINGVLLGLGPRYKQTGHDIHVDCPEDVELSSYPGALSQILSNLILNSLIHGFEAMEAGEIHIRVRRRGDHLELSYTDNGCGMSGEQREKVFLPFYTTRRGMGGTGLGMSIVYNLVTRTMDGGITLESRRGQGVKITLTLPDLAE